MKTLEDLQKVLKAGGDKHEQLREAIMRRIRMSRDKMSERYTRMAENEEQYAAYVPAKDVDELRKQKKKSEGEHDYISIEVPYSYAVTMTIHTYITSVFLARNPIYQLQARHGEAEQAVQGVEALLDYQRVAGGHTVPLFMWLFDPLKYGFGVLGQYWDEETIRCREFVEETPSFLGMPIPGAKARKVPVVKTLKGFAGNKLFNVRPQDFFPDVRVPLARFQEGEYCARYIELPWADLVEGQAAGRYFNVEHARKGSEEQGDIVRDIGSERVSTLPGERVTDYTKEKPDSMFKGYEVQWKLSPAAWRLGDESARETWVFTVSKTGTIVEVRPLGTYYPGFSYDVILYEPDGYNLFPVAALERIKPLNDVLSWLINSHFYNVRASLNNQFIVDPTMVVMKDVLSRKPGQIIRLKPEAYGRDVRSAIQQLPTGDVTRSHLQDAQLVELMIQRVLGATDNVMGMVGSGGRKTATEVRTSTSFGTNRLKTLCELGSAFGMEPMVQRMVQTTQQMFSNDDERKFKIIGDLSSLEAQTRVIAPEDIAGFYDYVPVDGTLPIDRYAQAQLWQALLGQIRNFPQIMQQYDLGKIFAWVATISGLKNVQQFRMMPQDPAALQSQAQAGNLVPISAAMKDLENVPDGGRIANMGAGG